MFNSSFNKGYIYKEQIKKYQENCLNRHSKASELILLMKHYQKDNSSSRQVKNLLQSLMPFTIHYMRLRSRKNLI